MFITSQQIGLILLIYLVLYLVLAISILRDNYLGSGLKFLKMCIITFIPILGLIIVSVDLLISIFRKKEMTG